jgi:2-iminoacetate synthase ThiH
MNVTAAARLLFRRELPHIQAVAWVKRGLDEAVASLHCGADDLGGTLIEERISRAAGATHGSYVPAKELRRRIEAEGLHAVERTTLYRVRDDEAKRVVDDGVSVELKKAS